MKKKKKIEIMKLTDKLIGSFCVAKGFAENTELINSIDFSPSGEQLITASDDDSIIIYDCVSEGKIKRTLFSRKYGVGNINYTHAGNTVIYSSNKVDDSIRYQSLHDNKYLRYFQGHTKRVVSLCMSPVEDAFLSGSIDKTVRLWDLRTPNCQGLMHMPGRPVASFDPEGLIFAVGINSEVIKLYDLKSFDKGPFTTFKMQQEKDCVWTDLKFSSDGKLILISTDGGIIRLIDAFNGQPLQAFNTPMSNTRVSLEASFSPDGQYVLSGAHDGRIHIWRTENGQKIAALDGAHSGSSNCVKFNPRYMMFSSACSQMKFWLPTNEE